MAFPSFLYMVAPALAARHKIAVFLTQKNTVLFYSTNAVPGAQNPTHISKTTQLLI